MWEIAFAASNFFLFYSGSLHGDILLKKEKRSEKLCQNCIVFRDAPVSVV